MSLRKYVRLAKHLQMLPLLESGEETLIGGQAVLEGVMMRSPHSYCVAVRRAGGDTITERSALARVSEKYPIFRYPVLRGLGTLGQAMWLGIRALFFSTNVAVDDAEPAREHPKPAQTSSWVMWLNLTIMVLFFLFLYKFVPLVAATAIGGHVAALHSRLAINMVDGVIRIGILLTFLSLMARTRDMRRLFQYHGAEHKVVFNFESGRPVTVENAQTFTTFHPRCGTSFMLVMMVIAMIVYALVPVDGFAAKLAVRVGLLPLVIGVSYELIRFAARRQGSFLAMLTAPGLWLQRVTTKPPSDDQAAIAIQALEGAMELEKANGGELVIA